MTEEESSVKEKDERLQENKKAIEMSDTSEIKKILEE